MTATNRTFQFTRPRGARLTVAPGYGHTPHVSIHAPARGATSSPSGVQGLHGSFNSRAREGRDQGCFEPIASPREFQFTRPRGARRKISCWRAPLSEVSIHAPARGATLHFEATYPAVESFNSRAREGRDGKMGRLLLEQRGFNSRAREGRDAGFRASDIASPVSIHAPARGATNTIDVSTIGTEWFQFTRPRGARPGRAVGSAGQGRVSIHAPARGATLIHLLPF